MSRADDPAPRWLTPAEMDAWLPFTRVLTLLPAALDRQLREEAGIPHVYYQVLAMLSAQPDDALRMTELARLTAVSPSRLSHAMTSLEQRAWVERLPCPQDPGSQLARLTPRGAQALEAVAPGHVAQVRRLVFDHLEPHEVTQLADLMTRLLDRATES